MPNTIASEVKNLSLDLHNFRTVIQPKEVDAIHALIAIDTDWFWALMESLLDSGYLPTENIIVLKNKSQLIVKEGNRRVAALKLIHGEIPSKPFDLPPNIQEKIANITADWKKLNKTVPTTIYELSEAAAVDKIVALTHGKGEKAGRAKWKAVARARHNRDMGKVSEPALDLLEKYFISGTNSTKTQRERWAGDYPLTVLDEAIKRVAPRLEIDSARKLVDAYPKIQGFKGALDEFIRDIGLEVLRFEQIRNTHEDIFFSKYGIPPVPTKGDKKGDEKGSEEKPPKGKSGAQAAGKAKQRARSLDDPRAVLKALQSFVPKGDYREKVVTLLQEIRLLKLDKHPHAFCFLLRSMFELSAKAYCRDHVAKGGPRMIKTNGEDLPLVDVLRDVTKHLTNNNKNKEMVKTLHGAMTELGKANGVLSVTSLNQLIHNPRFSVTEPDICALFHKIFPLLEEMNS